MQIVFLTPFTFTVKLLRKQPLPSFKVYSAVLILTIIDHYSSVN